MQTTNDNLPQSQRGDRAEATVEQSEGLPEEVRPHRL